MKKAVLRMGIITLLGLALVSCTNKSGAEKALKDAGYHPISIGGYGVLACSEDDFYT
jgi:hypothetical protein